MSTSTTRNRYSSTLSITPYRIEVRASSTEELLTLLNVVVDRAREAGYLGPLRKRERPVADDVLVYARDVDRAVGNLMHSMTNGRTHVQSAF